MVLAVWHQTSLTVFLSKYQTGSFLWIHFPELVTMENLVIFVTAETENLSARR